MPLWTITSPTATYSADDRAAIAAGITKLYTDGPRLPAFYVTVLFHELDPSTFFVGGEARGDVVRIAVDHIARRFDDAAEHLGVDADLDLRRAWLDGVIRALTPFTGDRGLHWELHADETPSSLWAIDGLAPPPPWSAEEARWKREGRASPTPTS
ncbi:tautomerase family protein [Patulibacter minatonensis]|uniref:tautomerase family protein n=1 Tax=Patulibacter minatonensis TaxID=298163 RepID=UPI00047D5410|nr:tautomerase family protein [Patulibacter minatonensis]